VLEALCIFYDTFYIKDKYAHENCYIAISKNGKVKEFKNEDVTSNLEVDFNPISYSNDPNSQFHFSRTQETEFKKYGLGSLEKFSNIQVEQYLDDLNKTLSILQISKIIAKSNDNPFLQGIIFTQNGNKIDIKSLSSGIRLIHSFRISIIKTLQELNRERLNNIADKRFPLFIIEEPETFLHPTFQKMFPSMLKSAILENQSLKLEVQFLISTHSPFIISSAAKEDGQKVYLIEKGQTKDAKTGELNTERSKSGYSGGECLFAVNEMLGSDINDIVPHTIFFCERSLKILLEKIFEKTDSKPKIPLIFTDIAGDDERIKNNSNVWKNIYDSIQKADKVKNILNYNIYGIIDQCQKADGWKKSLGEKLIIINDIELENLYKKDLVNQFLKDTKICQTEWKGGDFSKFIKENNLNKGEIKKQTS
jgi:AAA ATPase domain